jgi:hypothetical protein
MRWETNPLTGHVCAVEPDRTYTIERNKHDKLDLWCGRAGSRLRVGSFETLSLAKVIAEDIAAALARNRKYLEEQ